LIKLKIQNEKPNPVPVRWVQIWRPEPDLWIMCVDSPSQELELESNTEGFAVYSPYGTGTSVEIKVQTKDPTFIQSRFWSSVDRHHGEDHKYFLVKWCCSDSAWSDKAESEAFGRALRWIDSGKWQLGTGIDIVRGTI
jgi:hypothetical protein